MEKHLIFFIAKYSVCSETVTINKIVVEETLKCQDNDNN